MTRTISRAVHTRGPRRVAGQAGITLVELMVGLLIGMLAILVISQVLLMSEGQKRTTTGGADAQVNGALALYAMQRDIQTAGYGLTSSPAIVGCPISARFNGGGALPAGFATTLAPVFITPEASRPVGSVGDSIRMLASSKNTYSVPTRVIPPAYAVNGLSFPVTASMGFAQGDLALVAADAVQPCWVFQVTAAPTANSVPRADAPNGWNSAGTPSQAYGDGSILVNLGTLVDNRYEINNRVLELSSFDLANPNAAPRPTLAVQSDIVNLRAFYGRDTSVTADGIIDVYDTTTPTTNDGWLRLRSVRLIVVARSGQYEKEIVTAANPIWDVGTAPATTGAAACGGSACLTIDVGAGVAGDVEAKHYRYKIFETIVPLRNMLWSS
jgi:type IV pilus assembly protein PilW